MKRYLLFIIIILLSGCKKTTKPDNPPTITSFLPAETGLVRHIGDVVEFIISANDPDEDEVNYKFFKDGEAIHFDSNYSWTIDKKGLADILGIAYNDLADTTEWNVSVENQAPHANSFSLDMVEDEPKSIAKESLGTDPDRDNLSYRVLESNHATFELEVGNITFRCDTDYFGSAYIEFEVSDGELADTGRVDINITPVNDYPRIDVLSEKSGNEDEIPVGMVVQDIGSKITDVDDELSTLTLELVQSNPELIRLGFNADSSSIIVEYLKLDGNGSSDITLRATDPSGFGGEASFIFTVNPMPDISGRILDTDTQEPNDVLQAWVVINGDTTWVDNLGNYSAQIEPNSDLEIQAGYKQNGVPISYVTTIRNIDVISDVENFDIAVVTYLNMNTTPEEFRIMMDEVNFNRTTWLSDFAHGLRKDTIWYLIKRSPRFDIQHSANLLLLSLFTDEEWTKLQEMVNIVNNYLNNPLPIILEEINGYPETEEEQTGKIIIVKRYDAGAGSIGHLDYEYDGIIDFTRINLMDPVNLPGAVYEEAASALAGFSFVLDTRLAGGKTIYYEHEAIDVITEADIKSIRLTEHFTYGIGNLWIGMPIDDILKLQE